MSLSQQGVDYVKGSGLDFPKNDEKSRSLTRQSFAKDADINNIMSKYAVTGVLVDPANVDSERRPMFGDFSDLIDYPVLVSRINEAQAQFMTLPSEVRARFDNDVENLLVFLQDPKNVEEAVKMKILPEEMLPAKPAFEKPANEVKPEASTDANKPAA